METDLIRLLADLVACSSTNPRRAPVSESYPGEAPLLHLLEAYLRPLGARIDYQEAMPGRFNLTAFWDGRDRSRTLLLSAHADTVPQDGMTIPPFTPAIREGRLYGRGACDPKGGMAAMLAAITRRIGRGAPLPCNLCFAATCNEEFGADGARTLMQRHAGRFTMAVVAEPTDLAIVRQHKGALRFAIEAEGVAAHSSVPEQGASAIAAMSEVVRRIEGPLRDALNRRPHPVLGAPRVSVGLIQGGTQVNIVPAHCAVEVDRRTVPGETRESVSREVEDLLGAAREAGDPRVRLSARLTEEYPPLDVAEASPVCRLAAEACRRILGSVRLEAAPYATDAGVFHQFGLPAVVWGPGSIRQAHTRDEWVPLDQVRIAERVYETLIDLAGTEANPQEPLP